MVAGKEAIDEAHKTWNGTLATFFCMFVPKLI